MRTRTFAPALSMLAAASLAAACGSSDDSKASPGDGGQSGDATVGNHSDGGPDAARPNDGTAPGKEGGAPGKDGTAPGKDGAAPAGDSVLMHHKSPDRAGVYVEPALTKAAAASLKLDTSFNTTLDGAVYAQPLFVDGLGGTDSVIAATEANNVYAFNGATGAQVWMKTLGAPVPLAQMPCGNIDPYGVTGTPVIDLSSRTLYVGAMVTPDGGSTKQYKVFALSIDDGSAKAGWPVDMTSTAKSGGTSFTADPQSQRGALALINGNLYVPFGGLYGDCGNYHGWLVSISTSNPTNVQAWATGATGGGVWGASGVASDGTNVYITSGNTFGTTTWAGGEALVRFSTSAAIPANPFYWAPMNWKSLDDSDTDMSGTEPIVFDLPGSTPSHLVLVLGKDGNAYLEDPSNLGGVGAPLASLQATNDEIINAAVVYTTATATYATFKGSGANCTTGSGDLTTVVIAPGSPPSIRASWCGGTGSGSPMVTTTDGHSDAIVWVMGAESDGLLHGVDGDTGATVFDGSGMNISGMRRYNTPIAAKGRIFVPTDNGIVAFKP